MRGIYGLLIILLLVSLACNLTRSDNGDNQISSSSTPPTISIRNAPQRVGVGQTLTVEVEAIDPTGQGITRIEMRVNDRPVDEKSSPEARGITPFVANLSWTPTRPGSGILVSVRAWRGNISSVPQTLQVTVSSSPIPTATTLAGGRNFTPSAPTLAPCSVRVDVDTLRFRSVPDTSSDETIIKNFRLNDTAEVLGRLTDGSWYQVRDGNQVGWVFAGYTTLQGNCGTIPIQSAPTTPTPAPTATSPIPQQTAADLVALPISGRVSVELDQSGSATETYSLVVQNIGGTDSGQFQVQIVLPGGNERIQQVENLAAGQQLVLEEFQTVTFTTPGTQQISVHVDFTNTVAESNEGNNIALLNVIVTAPDLE